jgi:hypothetical protein
MRALLAITITIGLATAGCDLDEARGSGATKHHADKHDKKDHDDEAWDEATNEDPEPEYYCEFGVSGVSVACRKELEAACREQGGNPLVGGRVTCLMSP